LKNISNKTLKNVAYAEKIHALFTLNPENVVSFSGANIAFDVP
jgi:hypothetical protein